MFKTCTLCNHAWMTRNEFLKDVSITIVGYQASFDNSRPGYFLFNHTCGTTLSLKTEVFHDLYTGIMYQEYKTGGPDCPGLCLQENELAPCPAHCRRAFIRELIQIINKI